MKCQPRFTRVSRIDHGLIALIAVFCSTTAFGQRPPPGSHLPAVSARPALLTNVGIDQKLNAQVPPDLVFRDESGKPVKLGDYFGKDRPFVLALVYFKCPSLCTVVLNELDRTLRGMSLNVGEHFDVLTVSFDPHETPDLAAAKKAGYLKEYGRPGADKGWHFLTGDQPSITRLTDAVGFRYRWDAAHEQFVHASGLIVLTPGGRVSKYFFGVDYAPNDIKLALQQAAGNQVGTLADRVALYCFHYNPQTGKYGWAIGDALRLGGALTVLALGSYIVLSVWRDRGQPRPIADDGAATQVDDPDDPPDDA